MVFVHKTYGRVHGVLAKVIAVLMIILGFVVVVFLSLPKPVGFLGNIVTQGGVAHADAVSCDYSGDSSYYSGDSSYYSGDSDGSDGGCGCDSGGDCY